MVTRIAAVIALIGRWPTFERRRLRWWAAMRGRVALVGLVAVLGCSPDDASTPTDLAASTATAGAVAPDRHELVSDEQGGRDGDRALGGDDPSAPTRASSGVESTAGSGRLVIGVRTVPNELDPLRSLSPWGRRVADDLVFEALTRRDPTRHPWATLELAQRCVVDDPARITAVRCRLRPGARFHDGSVVTLEDVHYSVSHWLDPRREWQRHHHGLSDLAGVELVDRGFALDDEGPVDDGEPRWIEIAFARPQPLALELLAEIKIVPAQVHRRAGSAFARAPVGSGPMRVESAGDEELILRAAETYAGPSRVAPAIVLRRIDDGARGLTLLRRGELDVLDDVSPIHLPGELAKPGMAARFRGVVLTPPQYDVLLLNARVAPLYDPRLRAVVAASLPHYRLGAVPPATLRTVADVPIDLERPREVDLAALAEATDPRTADAGLPPARVNDDPARAMQASTLLDAAGWTRDRGQRRRGSAWLRLTLMWQGGGGRSGGLAAAVRHGLGELEVSTPYSTAAWSYVRLLLRRGEFEMFLLSMATHEDEDMYALFHRNGALNVTGVRSEALDNALDGYRAAMTAEQRWEAKQRVASALAAEHVALVLHAPARVALFSRRLGDVTFVDDLPRLDVLRRSNDPADGWPR